jgi:DNA-binding NarL/FixJ family response regulator
VTLSKCILIVDDSDNLRNSLRKFLERELGLTVCGEAVDGLDALEKVAHLSSDLIILDMVMPRMNGLETAREVRNVRVLAPIILFTMHSDALEFYDVQAAGIDAVVAKTNLIGLRQNIESLLAVS